MINGAINQTLSRTVLTSMTVFFVILCLFLFGGSVIHDFSFAMLIGVVTGSYSSVFVASPILIAYEDLKRRKLPKPVPRRTTRADAKPPAKRVAQTGTDSPAASPDGADDVAPGKRAARYDERSRNAKKSKKQPTGQPDLGKKMG